MARSYRTDPTKVISRRWRPEAHFECRIIERRPAIGDIHPLSAKQWRRIVQGLYKRYFYGLAAIELRPRAGSSIGCPYGEYLNDENTIRLYSVPGSEWCPRILLSLRCMVPRSPQKVKKPSSVGRALLIWPISCIARFFSTSWAITFTVVIVLKGLTLRLLRPRNLLRSVMPVGSPASRLSKAGIRIERHCS